MPCTSCGSGLSPDQLVCPKWGTPVPEDSITQISNNSIDNSPPTTEFGPFRESVSMPPITLYPGTHQTILSLDSPVEAMTQGYSFPPQIQETKQSQPQNELQQSDSFRDQSSVTVQKNLPPQSQRAPVVIIALLSILLALLIIGSSGLGYYAVVIRPAEFHAQATVVTHKLLATQAQATAQAHVLATATAAALTPDEIYYKATSGIPVINDPLDNKQGSSWIQTIPPQNICTFYGGAYHILVPADKEGTAICLAYGSLFSNLAFQVQVTFFQGEAAGLIFRTGNGSQGSYFFQISRWGDYAFGSFQGNDTTILASGHSHVINQGFYLHNLLTAVAIGNHMYLYVNKQLVANVTNSNYSSGQIALFASSNTGSTDVAFNNAQVWAM